MKGHAAKKGKAWYAVIEERDEQGRRRRRWHSGYRTKKEAEIAIIALLAKQQRGEYVPPSQETLGEYMRTWLDGRKGALRPSTWHGYNKNLRAHIEPRIGSIKVQHLTRERIGAFYATLQAERGLSARSVRHVHTLLRRALADLVRDGRLARNPAMYVELPKVDTEKMKCWTPADVRTFLEAIADDRLYALWRVAASTGMRRGELCGLRWQSVDLDAGTLSVDETLLDIRHELVIGQPKTGRGRRVLALDAGTVAALRAHKARQAAERLAFGAGFNDGGYVFVREDGAPVHPAWLTRAFSQRVKAAGLPKIRLHDLRHTAATLSLAAGVPIPVVSERLGHARTSITLDWYGHALPGQHREAADKLAALIGGA